MSESAQDIKKLLDVFLPYSQSRTKRMYEEELDFAHYTSASNAMRIIRSQKVTLRRSSLMNDFSEIDHGERCVAGAWNSKDGKGVIGGGSGLLGELLDGISPLIVPGIERSFDKHLTERKSETFLLSLAEHDERTEGRLGRLSMWRAYGGRTNVALVIDKGPLLRDTSANIGFTSPVLYSYVEDFHLRFREFVENLYTHEKTLREIGSEAATRWLTLAFNAAAMSTKHPGFSEEREWRIIYAPWLSRSDMVDSEIVEIEGVPQRVQTIDLFDDPSQNLVGIEPPALLKKLIIGPTENPYVLYDAFVEELDNAGVENAAQKVVVSDIPIRR